MRERTNLENFFNHYDRLRGDIDRLVEQVEETKRRKKDKYFELRESDDEGDVQKAMKARGAVKALNRVQTWIESVKDNKDKSENVYLNLVTIMEKLDQAEDDESSSDQTTVPSDASTLG